MLDQTNLLSDGYCKRIQELEAQRNALSTDVATLEEEVEATRKHVSERFTLARQKQEIEDKYKALQESHSQLVESYSDIKERVTLFSEISSKNHSLEQSIAKLEIEYKSVVKDRDEIEKIRLLQDKAIRELFDNEKYLKQNLEKITHEYSEYKIEMEAKYKKTENIVQMDKTLMKKIK